jgi:hypothetical protein
MAMTHRDALLILHARLLGATWNRISELYDGNSQRDGMNLIAEAEHLLGLEMGTVDADDTEKLAKDLHTELGVKW